MRAAVSMWGVLSLFALASSALASPQSCPCKQDDDGQICPLQFVTNQQSDYTNVQGIGSFSASDLVAPEPIPFEVQADDGDNLRIKCGNKCEVVPIPGVWTANWTRSLLGGSGSPGAFVDPLANLDTQVQDATCVLYLPPKDLSIGETRSIRVLAMLQGTCSCATGDDPSPRIKFRVDVTRTAEHAYTVAGFLEDITQSPTTPSLCASGFSVCELLKVSDTYCTPDVSIVEYPAAGMVLGEMRPIRGFGEDLDRWIAECGTPPGHDPVESNFGFGAYCDELMYTWTVIAGPGNGAFTNQGRSAIFFATTPGSVTIRLTVTALDGETNFKDESFTIHAPRVVRMSYGNSHPVARDDGGGNYDKPHWRDSNGDGDASDPGERRISAAYTRNTHAQVERVFIECGTMPPPYGVVRGALPSGQGFRSAAFNCTDGSAGSTELFACDMTAIDPLPDAVKKLDPFEIQWTLAFNSLQDVDTGRTETWLYVTFGAPIGSYPRFESLYDVSCIAADGQTSAAGTTSLIWQQFPDRDVRRKSRDGFNAPDGLQMGYWLNPATVCVDMAGMLADPNGDGKCQAWAELMHGCMQMHGINTASIYEASHPPATAFGGIMIKNWNVPPQICVGANGVDNSTTSAGDVTAIPLNQGLPNVQAIGPGANGVLNTTPAGDDLVTGGILHDGANGVCNTTAAGDDVQLIAVGNGLAHGVIFAHITAILAGTDGVLTSTTSGDDHTFQQTTDLGIGTQIFDVAGIPGQKNANPIATFKNHAVIRIGDRLYDPSYGVGPFGITGPTTGASSSQHENASLEAISLNGTHANLQDPLVNELIYVQI